ncbi:MAG: M20/M25/M40 family metallo-hydrolase [Candidatus Dadabacteria bacterium]|nr:MAG: M20/M25/M40 family metallo-hydrolase [Candidatus Dadabacteria bacterium]
MHISAEIIEKAEKWLADLIRIDTSNPPGQEKEYADAISEILKDYGITPTVIALDASRPNLFCEISAESEFPAILLSSHADVVPVEDPASWKVPPFSGQVKGGELWGRGALDMKYKTAFDLAVMVLFKDLNLRRPLKMIVVADEEEGCKYGSSYLVKEHLELIRSEYVFNELGGFNLKIGSKEFYPVQAGEKSFCHLRLHVKGRTGHASVKSGPSSIDRLAEAINAINNNFLGFSLCTLTEAFIKKVADSHHDATKALFEALLEPEKIERTLELIPDHEERALLKAMLCNTVTATRIGGGFKVNVIPEAVWADLDCRLVPGVKSGDFIKQLEYFFEKSFPEDHHLFEIEEIQFQRGYQLNAEEELVGELGTYLEKTWKGGISVPLLLPASSDNSNYYGAGIIPVGFAPLKFPDGFAGFLLSHSNSERIPLESFKNGLECYVGALKEIMLRD